VCGGEGGSGRQGHGGHSAAGVAGAVSGGAAARARGGAVLERLGELDLHLDRDRIRGVRKRKTEGVGP
jgi:hypothetical protein